MTKKVKFLSSHDQTPVLPMTLFVLSLLFIFFNSSTAARVSYNVQELGAKPDGNTDATEYFLRAWTLACASTMHANIYVPPGRYLLRSQLAFNGAHCKYPIYMRIDGTLVAPSDYNVLGNAQNWITFERVDGLRLSGGTLDAQGAGLWACKASAGKSCPRGATTLGIYTSNDVVISGLISLNSQMFHMIIYGCSNTILQGIKIIAPKNSPNTDGIHVQLSDGVSILSSQIGTGDDCISIGPGTTNTRIESVFCGPGHGISIGSLGWTLHEPGVENLTVKTIMLYNTDNGVRIKTWARASNGFVRNVLFQNVEMSNVQNPILIDQEYCPHGNCPNQVSGVKINNVIYQDIHGTSATPVAIRFECSKKYPCSEMRLQDVKLTYNNQNNQEAIASCTNAGGMTYGVTKPSGCL